MQGLWGRTTPADRCTALGGGFTPEPVFLLAGLGDRMGEGSQCGAWCAVASEGYFAVPVISTGELYSEGNQELGK